MFASVSILFQTVSVWNSVWLLLEENEINTSDLQFIENFTNAI